MQSSRESSTDPALKFEPANLPHLEAGYGATTRRIGVAKGTRPNICIAHPVCGLLLLGPCFLFFVRFSDRMQEPAITRNAKGAAF